MGTDYHLFTSYAGLLGLAVSIIYSGSHESLPSYSPRTKGEDADEVEANYEELERVTLDDAWLFPIFGSVSLYGLYLIIKYYGSDWINSVLKWYFVATGVGSVWSTFRSLVRFMVGAERWESFRKRTFKYTKGNSKVQISWRTPTLYLFPIAVLPSFLYAVSDSPKSALLTDILAVSFSFNAISWVQLDSFLTGSVVLGGLFVYDIWWVFGTDVMVKVATKLDAPVKLLWPKSMWLAGDRGFTMLGLGDVVIPGIFVALSLRYDVYQEQNGKRPGRVFFWASLTGYSLGLFTTMAVMHLFRTAQPALLYISPACIMSVLITGFIRGELKDMWEWVDGGRQVPGPGGADGKKKE